MSSDPACNPESHEVRLRTALMRARALIREQHAQIRGRDATILGLEKQVARLRTEIEYVPRKGTPHVGYGKQKRGRTSVDYDQRHESF